VLQGKKKSFCEEGLGHAFMTKWWGNSLGKPEKRKMSKLVITSHSISQGLIYLCSCSCSLGRPSRHGSYINSPEMSRF